MNVTGGNLYPNASSVTDTAMQESSKTSHSVVAIRQQAGTSEAAKPIGSLVRRQTPRLQRPE
ncbi:58_t:CDS:2 [Paraglomus occultum]|uniref:58_t:CDS:1 n=1 Tax=Paraglomus occultum TaxID=144539 RepID=A0A9N9CQL3_9GLOM|nr:58_t:CDS:2 [Paraglomus occultum]